MYKLFVKIYVLILIIFTVEKSDCKQGAACLSYGHSCWGAHGKRNADASNDPNAWFWQRMAAVQRPADGDPSADQGRPSRYEDDVPKKYFDIFKTYAQRSPGKPVSDDAAGNWDAEPGKYAPAGRHYGDRVLDPRMAYYKLAKIL